MMNSEKIRNQVRERYAWTALGETSGCCGSTPSTGSGCCGSGGDEARLAELNALLGYGADEANSVPEGANLGLGCGNPTAIASIPAGSVVLDLGSGAGFDCFLAARQVGSNGHVIGVDMTPEMVAKARDNARRSPFSNVEFRPGEIEKLPVEDASVDVIISNCVVNLSPDKPAVFREAFRVLKPGGRVAISDVVSLAQIPDDMRSDPDAWSGCLAGAETPDHVRAMLAEAGFHDISIREKETGKEIIRSWSSNPDYGNLFSSAYISATKPVQTP